jgi:hypothetical protein
MSGEDQRIVIRREGKDYGPYTRDQARRYLNTGNLSYSDTARLEGGESWLSLATVLGIAVPPPPIPPPTAPAATVATSPPPPNPLHTQVTMLQNATAPDSAVYYYCTDKGKRVGPISAGDLANLLDAETLTNETLIWHQGLDDWVPIGRTSLRHKPKGPPPVSGAVINNTLVWIVAFVPIIGAVIVNVIAGASGGNPNERWTWWVFIGLNVILCGIDTNILKEAGYNTDRFGSWLWLVPVYLFKRAKALKQPLSYFTVWMICFFVSLFL